MEYSIKNFNSYITEGVSDYEYEVISIETLQELQDLCGRYWNHFSKENEKFFNALLNETKNNIFLVLDIYTEVPKYIIFWDRMIVIDVNKSVLMFQDYENFIQNNKEIKKKIERIIKYGKEDIKKDELEKTPDFELKPKESGTDATTELKNKSKIKTDSFDLDSFRNLHLNKNLSKLQGFVKIPRPRY